MAFDHTTPACVRNGYDYARPGSDLLLQTVSGWRKICRPHRGPYRGRSPLHYQLPRVEAYGLDSARVLRARVTGVLAPYFAIDRLRTQKTLA